MIRILIGGSPCTYWSVAQKNNREITAEGLGWDLFRNYLIAKEKFMPDYFLYENNKSAAAPIKAQIAKELEVYDGTMFMPDKGVRMTYINSALVSAQNRERFYVTNFGDIEQPEDRGILLRDILETCITDKEKAYCLKHQAGNTIDYFKKHHTQVAFEPVAVDLQVAGRKRNADGEFERSWEAREDGKSGALTSVESRRMVAGPVRIGTYPTNDGELKGSQGKRIYGIDGKSTTLCGQGGGQGAKTGLYAVPFDGKSIPIYEVRNGLITIKDKQYPIKLADGYYIIRKLTVTECMRLQTIPEWYIMPCSASQNYIMLGNGWTVEVIMHLLSHIPNIRNEEIEVLSMYDGMSCGQIALMQMGCNVKRVYATEINKYAIQTTQYNFPDTIQLGDAFQVRDDNWHLPV